MSLTLPRLQPASRWPAAWIGLVSMALLALAYWQQDPTWQRWGGAMVCTVASVGALRAVRRVRWAALCTITALVLASLEAARDTATLATIETDWARWSEQERVARAQRIADRVTEVGAVLRADVERLTADPAFEAQLLADEPLTLTPPLPSAVESALLVFRSGRLLAHAGQMHSPVDADGPLGVTLVDGAFHTSLVARGVALSGDVVVVATALISSAPPADRFSRSLLRSLAGPAEVAHTLVESPDSTRVIEGSTVVLVPDGPRRLARVRATTYTAGETRLALEQQARLRSSAFLLLALLGYLIVAWHRPAGMMERTMTAGVVLAFIAMTPLSRLSNVSSWFDPGSFFVASGGPWTSTAAAMLATALLLLALVLFFLRDPRRVPSRRLSATLVFAVAATAPFLLRGLARGIALPVDGAGFNLWAAWQLAVALAAVALLLVGAVAGQGVIGVRRPIPASIGPLLALMAGAAAPLLLTASGTWPAWYPVLWGTAVGALALTRRGLAQIMAAVLIAGSGAATLTWGATVRARLALATHDLERLSVVDDNAVQLLDRFAAALRDETRPMQGSDALLRRYAASELAMAGYPARLARWAPEPFDRALSVLELVPVNDSVGAQAYLAMLARQSGGVELRTVNDGPTTLLMAAVPAADGTVTTITVPPRTRLLPSDPFAALTGVAGVREHAPPYKLELTAPMPGDTITNALRWQRRGDALHGDGVAGDPSGVRRVHVEVDLRSLDALLPRGALFLLLDALVVFGVWLLVTLADGSLRRLLRVRRVRWSRSYRLRLSAALMAFFLAPAAVFGLWAWYRLQDDDRATRELLVRETLRIASVEQEQRGPTPSSTGAPLFLYRDGLLLESSEELLDALAPLGRLLPTTLNATDFSRDAVFATRRVEAGDGRPLVGYRRLTPAGTRFEDVVLATPARGDDFALDLRREDLGLLALFVAMIGALAAVWSSGVAARALSRPIGALREAALSLAAGRPMPSLGDAPATEFAPVYGAFRRMADDLATSRAALEAAQRRTSAVLHNVASGVLALRAPGDILLANPRAAALLGVALRPDGTTLADFPSSLAPLVQRTQAFLAGDAGDDAFEVQVEGQQLQARLTRFATGVVLTLDDITALASAQRVLAWGEMARQVAHEIKNPLTPIRLGVQHLRRAFRDQRTDFSEILDTNVTRILAEIDHLDQIARAFSQYGTVPAERTPPDPVELMAVTRDVLALERMGAADGEGAPVQWVLDAPSDEAVFVWARPDELREVLLNLLENARLAEASQVTVRVRALDPLVLVDVIDDGIGIAADVLPHVFEPHFSTRTSGSGLGLAISRRLVENWGGTVTLSSAVGSGTTVHLALRRCAALAEGANAPVAG